MPKSKPEFWKPLTLDKLTRVTSEDNWLWRGILAPSRITLLAAEYKAGKTTFISLLLKAMKEGGTLCGAEVKPGSAVIVSEEPADFWIDRNEHLDLGNHVQVIEIPFAHKPSYDHWKQMIEEAVHWLLYHTADLVVFDTLSHLWCVERENDNAEVSKALMPLRAIARELASVLLVHHFGAGTERMRGATELGGFVDTIVQLHRAFPENILSRERRLKISGRLSREPSDMRIELNAAGTDYDILDGQPPRTAPTTWEIVSELISLAVPPGWSAQDFRNQWPSDRQPPTEKKLLDLIKDRWQQAGWSRTGAGVKGDPFHWYKADQEIIPPLPLA